MNKPITTATENLLRIPVQTVSTRKKHLDVCGCWGSDYAHFHRAVEMLRTPAAAALWSQLKLDRYNLSKVNEALEEVASGRSIKALIVPRR